MIFCIIIILSSNNKKSCNININFYFWPIDKFLIWLPLISDPKLIVQFSLETIWRSRVWYTFICSKLLKLSRIIQRKNIFKIINI